MDAKSCDALPDNFEIFRHDNPEQFTTLCLMHLSFCLDLSDHKLETLLECKTAEQKAKTKNHFLWKQKGANNVVVNNTSLSQECQYHLSKLIQILGRDKSVLEEWLFRKSGSKSREDDLLRHLKEGIHIDLEGGIFSIHDYAALLKHTLDKLAEPLLTEAFYPYLLKVPDMYNEDMLPEQKQQARTRQLKTFQLLLMLLPLENYYLLKDLLMLLKKVSNYSNINQMNSESLATVFAPHFICRKKTFVEDMQLNGQKIISTLKFMIENTPGIFNVPNELIIDVERNRKLSVRDENPKRSKKSSNRDTVEDDAIETTVAFCDRSKSALYSPSEYTNNAIKNLQAHLENMPDSAQKKKLIKQFNENGLGTPVMNQPRKHQRSRSLGGAIKKQFRRHVNRKVSSSDSPVLPEGRYRLKVPVDDTWGHPSQNSSPRSKAKVFGSTEDALNMESPPLEKTAVRISKRMRVKKVAVRKTILPD